LQKWKNLTSEETVLSIWYLAARATLLELENALPSQTKPKYKLLSTAILAISAILAIVIKQQMLTSKAGALSPVTI
jgi:hypothetical protein